MIYNMIEQMELVEPNKVRFITSRQSIKEELIFLRNNKKWKIDFTEKDDLMVGIIEFSGVRQMRELGMRLRIHKLFKDKPLEFVRTILDSQRDGVTI